MSQATTTEFQVEELKVDGQHEYDSRVFPLILECKTPEAGLEAALAWVREHREELDQKAASLHRLYLDLILLQIRRPSR